MKTYILKGWDTDKKITVDDDVIVSASSNYERGENMQVNFVKPKINYDNDLIAAFDRVNLVFEEGTDILEHTWEIEKCDPVGTASNSKRKWIAVK